MKRATGDASHGVSLTIVSFEPQRHRGHRDDSNGSVVSVPLWSNKTVLLLLHAQLLQFGGHVFGRLTAVDLLVDVHNLALGADIERPAGCVALLVLDHAVGLGHGAVGVAQ